MCGIVAYFTPSGKEVRNLSIQEGLAALRHRGPNDVGHCSSPCVDGELLMGHARLSIIDLTHGGHQPMWSRNGRFIIAFNGEIYNYKELRAQLDSSITFRSDSDTEVLLASWERWGSACLPRLRGMFAFVVFDCVTSVLTCVRDAFGIKPLFFHQSESGIAIASEVPALMRLSGVKPRLNLQRAYDYLVHGAYDDQGESFIAGLRHVEPGTVVEFHPWKRSESRQWKWFDVSISERGGLSFDQAADAFRELFLESVKLHLRSDVPLGAALSGGLDSSAVVCAMRRLQPDRPIHTFSYVARGTDRNEEAWVDLVNNHVGAISHKVLVTSDELAGDLDDLILSQGEPFATTSIYAQYRVFRAARECGITVTLDGQGADELLAGYNGYPAARMRTLLDQRKLLDIARFGAAWSQWPGRTRRDALVAFGAATLPDSLVETAYRLIGRTPEPMWLRCDFLREAGVRMSRRSKFGFAGAKKRQLAHALHTALSGGGLQSLLRHGDRNSMRWSIESRVPFLTDDLARFVLQLPEDYLLSPTGETKRLLRAAMRSLVPDFVLDRKDKVGFETPEAPWLRHLGERCLDYISAADSLVFLDAQRCREEVTDIVSGRKAFSYTAWRLMNFCRWVQLFDVRLE